MSIASVSVARDYAVGQVWSYKTREGDQSSRVLINAVESVPKLGTIYHVSILRVHMPKMSDGTRGVTDVAHLPVSKATLDGSVVALTGTREQFPGYRGGYDQWKKAFDAGRAGVFK